MGSIHHAKRNIRLTMAWPAIIVMVVGVMLISGCAEFKMSREDTRIENRSAQGMVTASNRSTSMTPASFLEQLWGHIGRGDEPHQNNDRQANAEPYSIEASWRMEVR